MTRQELYQKLKHFDWYYDYSDDGEVWRRGRARQQELEAELRSLGCTFAWWDIFRSISGFILENAVEVMSGEFRFPKWLYDSRFASLRRTDLITQAQHDEIQAWFNA